MNKDPPQHVARTARGLTGWFDRTPFALKFTVVGLLLAGPLLVCAGAAVSIFQARLSALQAVDVASHRADAIRTLAISIARHRGLSASLLSGGEDVRGQLVAEQRFLLPQLERVLAELDDPALRDTGLPEAAALRSEMHALVRLPDAAAPSRNFQRHNEVISALLAMSARLAHGLDSPPARALTHDTVFVELPLLMEELGRQRGWGSAILILQQASEVDRLSFELYAGAVARRLEWMRADPATLQRLDALHGAPGRPVREALAAAEDFHLRSLAALSQLSGDDGAGRRHFDDGTAVIDRLVAVDQALASELKRQTAVDLSAARAARNAGVLALLGALGLLFFVYRTFERSTVQRLRALGEAAQRLARSRFDEAIAVGGRDEIAELGQALDQARQLLREAVADRARGLAALEADRAKTDFLARWSHDLRTPLNAVLGFAELIESRPGPRLSDAQRGDLLRIRRAGAHLLCLVDDVLDISRIEAQQLSLQPESLDLLRIVADAADLAGARADAAAVQLALPPVAEAETWTVLADRTRLLQILVNLLSNAVKFNRPGGRVEVTLRREGGETAVEVQDTGPGIAPEGLARLFKPFERLNAAARHIEGSGLGLALSQRLAGLMSGRIEVRNLPDEGACFTLWLPAHDTAAAASGLGEHVPPAPAVGSLGGHIAYVEDDPVNAVLLRDMLADMPGLAITVFPDAAAALRAASDDAQFDLWLIDRQLPDGDGLLLLARLREHGAARRAVMLSADALPAIAAAARAAGYDDYWTKPISRQALRHGVARYLSEVRQAAAPAATRN